MRSAPLVKFAAAARAAGMDADGLFRHVGADLRCMDSPDLFVPDRWLTDILEATERRTGVAAVGIVVAQAWRMADFGPLALLLQHQPTLRHAVGQFESYRHLRSQAVTLRIHESGPVGILQLELRTERAGPGRHVMELSLGTVMALLRWFLGAPWVPRGVRFSHAAPGDVALHRRLFGCPVEFGCEFDGIVLDRADLDRPNPHADVHLARYAKEFLDLQAPGRQAPASLATRRSLEQLLPVGRCGVDDVAAQLGTSARTLQRRLSDEGTDFSAVLNEVRRALAERYLGDPRYPVAQVGVLLGFSDPSAFTRWFSVQFGRPPREWRRKEHP